MSTGWVTLTLDRPRAAFRGGDTVAGEVAAKWRTRARAVRVRLEYVELTRYGASVRIAGPQVELPGGEFGSRRFTLTLPPGAPPTLRAGALGTVTWRVAARVDRFGPDDRVAAELDVI